MLKFLYTITYPTTLDTLPNPTAGELLENAVEGLDHDKQHSNANDAIEALEAKVGADGSAVTTSHDYKLSEVTDKAVGKTATQTLTNKTLTSPIINLSSNATGDMYYRASDGTLARLPIGTAGNIIQVSAGGVPEYTTNPNSDAIRSIVTRTYLNAASPATWTKPAGLKYIIVEVQAGGGGGGYSASGGSGGDKNSSGGGGGGYSKKLISVASLGATETVTIGAGGTAGTSTTGGTGGSSSFGSHCSATGGGGGTNIRSHPGGTGGIGSSGDINCGGTAGGSSGLTGTCGGAGGASILGGGGSAGDYETAAENGKVYGGGGGGAQSTGAAGGQNGGAGGAGIVIVTEYLTV